MLNKHQRHIYYIATILVFATAVILPARSTHATTYSLTVATSGNQSVNIVPSSSGTTASIGVDNITVSTTCRSGYNFALSTSVNDNNLYLNGDSANNTSGTYFAPASGSSALASSPNTWGYYYDSSITPTASSIFSAVPALGNSATIISPLATPSSSDISDSFSIYYGAASPSNMPVGSYKMIPDTNNNNNNGAIIYYITMADACTKYTVHFDPTSTNTGTSITGTGTMRDQLINEGVATNLTTNSFTAPNGYEFTGWNTAQDGTGTAYTDGQSVTDLTTVGTTITLYAQWREVCPSGYICYHENGDNVEGTMGQQSVGASDTSITLLASNFSRTGYGFAGWSDVEDYATNPNAHFYGPQEDIAFTAGTYTSPNNGLDLYAVWIASEGYLQDSSKIATLCGTGTGSLDTAPIDGTANLSSVSALTDQRDNETYAIAKLADGKCWMIENLRLEAAGTVGNNETDPTVTNQSLSQGYNSSFIGLADPESANFSDSTTANSLYSTDGSTAATISGSNQGYRFPRYNNLNTPDNASNRPQNPTSNTFSNDNTTVGMYSYGNYYTWAAVIADTTHYTSGDHNTTSICPTGWRIPTGNTSGEFYALNTAINSGATDATASNKLRSYPNNFLYSGAFTTSSASSRGSSGLYLSSTAYSGYGSYNLYLDSSIVRPGSSSYVKYHGYSARCVVSGS